MMVPRPNPPPSVEPPPVAPSPVHLHADHSCPWLILRRDVHVGRVPPLAGQLSGEATLGLLHDLLGDPVAEVTGDLAAGFAPIPVEAVDLHFHPPPGLHHVHHLPVA